VALDTPNIHGDLRSGLPLTSRQTKTAAKTIAGEVRSVAFTFLKVLAGYLVLAGIVAAVQFPYHSDTTVARSVPESAAAFYSRIYAARAAKAKPVAEASPDQYVATAQETISALGLVQAVKNFVHQFGLEHARVLDVGAGTGYLQDVVDDYVGLDISPEAARFYHKPFIQASATEMPVPDSSFDAIWSIFVLEHVPNPEQALVEMRRTVKNGGLLWLAPAWDCQSWYADGYTVRPFADLDWKGKIYKAGIPMLEYPPFKMLSLAMTRVVLRAGRLGGGPAHLHYRPLKANYEKYWMPDSDAVNSLDRDEMRQWFTSRGDECLNCDRALWDMSELIIKVHK
jgi:ubiquinone/menaquinone biosynthesis C-methylase UbiE